MKIMIIRSQIFSHSTKVLLNVILIGFVITVLTGCISMNKQVSNSNPERLTPQSDDDVEASTTSVEQANSYPVVTRVSSAAQIDSYPVTMSSTRLIDSYPIPVSSTGVILALNKPITLSDMEVSGVGPPGLPINIVNITLMGEQLGSDVISNDGTFSIVVNLQANTRVGINADIEVLGLTSDDIQPGDGAMNVPLVGYFFDTAVISQN